MRFWWIAPLLYICTLTMGLLLPGGTILTGQGGWLTLILWYGLTAAVMAFAAFMLTLMASKVLFPHYWWLGQVLGEDVYELEGVYFVGVRLARVPTRLQRLVFGAGERFRRWDLAFGLIWLLLVIAHGMGAMTADRALESYLPIPVVLPETMHAALLSDLPVMRALGKRWTADQELSRQLENQVERLQAMRGKTEADWFRLAQLHLARAFRGRYTAAEAFRYSPMDRAFFEHGMGAQAADDVTQILAVPESKRAPLTRGALTLLGFFYLSEYNYARAEQVLIDALASPRDDSGISLSWTRLLAAQVALQRDEAGAAEALLEVVLAEPNLPKRLEGLALEHLSEAKRLNGDSLQVKALLDHADRIYADLADGGGIARIRLRRAVWLADQGATDQGREELSAASAQAEKARDVFALNMVARVSQLLPALR